MLPLIKTFFNETFDHCLITFCLSFNTFFAYQQDFGKVQKFRLLSICELYRKCHNSKNIKSVMVLTECF